VLLKGLAYRDFHTTPIFRAVIFEYEVGVVLLGFRVKAKSEVFPT
jgi:hypothetical protein